MVIHIPLSNPETTNLFRELVVDKRIRLINLMSGGAKPLSHDEYLVAHREMSIVNDWLTKLNERPVK